MALQITVGAGLKRPQGRRLAVTDVDALGRALRDQPPVVEGWWSPHLWRGDARDGTRWESASAIGIDLDRDDHAELSPEVAEQLEGAARDGGLVGSLFHRTPAGARIIFVLSEPCADAASFARAAEGAAQAVADDLKELSISGIQVDPKPHADLARLYFTPNSIAKGVPRRAAVITMRSTPYPLSEVAEMRRPLPAVIPIRPTNYSQRPDPTRRAAAYVAAMGYSVEGNHGDDHAFKVAAVLVNDFALPDGDARSLMEEWNTLCQPPWSEKDLTRFLRSAGKSSKHPTGEKLATECPAPQRHVPRRQEPEKKEPAKAEQAFGIPHDRQNDMAAGKYEPAPLVPTGIHKLDDALGGGIPLNKLAVIAARTSHGKTATTVRLAVNMALAGKPVVVVWCEDEEVEFDLRSLSVLSRTPFPEVLYAYRAKKLASIWGQVPQDKKRLWKANCNTIRIERPTPELLADYVRTVSGGTFLLDHIGEVNWGDGRKHELIGDGLRLIRKAAIDSKCLFIAMAQLNRDWDRRKASSENPDKVRPCLSDIENSGQIEQVARVCIIAEKAMTKQNEEDVPTGEYRYHVFKPRIATAVCRWHEATATPDNAEPVVMPAIPARQPTQRHWQTQDTEED